MSVLCRCVFFLFLWCQDDDHFFLFTSCKKKERLLKAAVKSAISGTNLRMTVMTLCSCGFAH